MKRSFEKTATTLASMTKNDLKQQIKNFSGRFRLDFTEAYLEKLSVDKLRHILLAAFINAKSSN